VLEEVDEQLDVTTKDVLSYSWRALKESRYSNPAITLGFQSNISSLLMREIITNGAAELDNSNRKEGNIRTLASLGGLCFTELAELRHRGAFSTVAQTFAALCQQCSLSKDDDIRALLRQWYKVGWYIAISGQFLVPDCR